jgi:hypothetical protein
MFVLGVRQEVHSTSKTAANGHSISKSVSIRGDLSMVLVFMLLGFVALTINEESRTLLFLSLWVSVRRGLAWQDAGENIWTCRPSNRDMCMSS